MFILFYNGEPRLQKQIISQPQFEHMVYNQKTMLELGIHNLQAWILSSVDG